MNALEQFRQGKVSGREQILKRATEVLTGLEPVSIHQFGSGATQFRDEFSDLDLFMTVTDQDFKKLVPQRAAIYAKVAPILVRLYTAKPNKIGWYHDLIIHQTNQGLFHVDYFLTPESKVILPPNAALLHGKEFPPGSWETWTTEKIEHEPKPAERELDAILAMSYIGVKGIVRKWGPEFYNFVRGLYKGYQAVAHKKLPELPPTIDFNFILTTLANLEPEATEKQKEAINKIRKYANQVEQLYIDNPS